jgi:hypothetical protein
MDAWLPIFSLNRFFILFLLTVFESRVQVFIEIGAQDSGQFGKVDGFGDATFSADLKG